MESAIYRQTQRVRERRRKALINTALLFEVLWRTSNYFLPNWVKAAADSWAKRRERERDTTKRQQSSLAKASPLKSQAIKRHPLPHSDISAATMGASFSSVIYKVVLQLESCIHSWPTWVSPLTAERLESLSLEHMFQILHLRMSRAFNISINGNHTLFLSNRLSHSVNLIILNDSQTQLRGWYLLHVKSYYSSYFIHKW